VVAAAFWPKLVVVHTFLGYRQFWTLDVAAFVELLHRVGAMVEGIAELAELDRDPVFVRRHGADVRVRLIG